jgi:hypothetical protein
MEVSKASDVVSTFVTEEQSPFSNNPALNLEAIMFYKFLAVSSILTFMLNYRRLNLSQLLLYAAFFYISTLAVRNIALFAIISAPIAIYNMGCAATSFDFLRRLRLRFIGLTLRWGVSIGLVLLVLYYILSVFSNEYYLRNGRFTRTGLGLSEVRYPKEAIDFVQRNGIKGAVFNSPGLGGYFIWRSFPGEKVFYDSRFGLYGFDFHKEYSAILNNPEYFNAVAESYGVNYAVVEHSSGFSGFLGSLYRNPQWKLVYCDGVAVVFVKNTARNQKAIDSALCDLESEATSDVGAIERNYLERIDEGFFACTMRLVRLFREGSDPMTHLNRGAFFNIMGLVERAEEEHLKSLAMFPHQQMAHFNLGLAYLDQGKMNKAAREFEFVLEINPGNEMARKFLDFIGGKT